MTLLRPMLALLLAAMLAACSATNMGRMEVDEDGETITKVYSSNSLLSSRISVQDLKQKTVGDLLYIQATLENDWKFELDFQYKFKWFDLSLIHI